MKKVWMLYWVSLALTFILGVLSATQVGVLYGLCTVNMRLVNAIGATVFVAMAISYVWLGIVFISGGHDKV